MGRLAAADRKGTVLVSVTVMLAALMGFVALGIEVGTWYVMRAELSKAVDAAALAGAANIASPNLNLAALAQDFGRRELRSRISGDAGHGRRRSRLHGQRHNVEDDGDGERERPRAYHEDVRGDDRPRRRRPARPRRTRSRS